MNIRPAELHDAEPLAELIHQLGYPTNGDVIRQRLQDLFSDANNHVFVAQMDGKIVGVMVLNYIRLLHKAERKAMISALVVDEAMRGSGVGAALLERAYEHANASGCTVIELSSNESRTRAHAFYEKHGFVEKRKRFVRTVA
jgi:ribosomal protein S18 acetylase RimI-like enzyme